MAFFTSVRASVPMYQEESDDDTCSESSTLQSSADPARQLSSALSTPTPAPLAEDQDTALREGFSTDLGSSFAKHFETRLFARLSANL